MEYKAKDIAQWFINRAALDVNDNGGEYVTHLKLQKLLYYAQGCYGAMKDSPLFIEKIYHWAHGPVVADLYDKFSKYKDNGIKLVKPVEIDEETEAVLEEVYNVFGRYSAWGLRNMTHDEDPWKNTDMNDEITFDSICDYFKREIVKA